ncbi:MAG: LptF/LptG family permease [Fuerstiella sp.]|nr:LptF/LptG family permease [Fuerstiella sp.]
MNTFDKYLLKRFLHTFMVFFVATYGLYIVVDLFSNMRDFQRGAEDGATLAKSIFSYYGYHASEFLDLAGPLLIGVSAITVFGLLEKHSESHPILAAGIPAFRLLRPILVGGALINLILILNQELIMPRLSVELQTRRGADSASKRTVEPVYDYSNYEMHIDGSEVIIEERKLVNPSFFLPAELAKESFSLEAESAVYMVATSKRRAGWLLQNLTGLCGADMLTEEGRTRIISRPNGRDVFIVSSVSFDQLYNRGRNLRLLSSAQLVKRIRNPSTGPVPVKAQTLALHARITRPIISLLAIAMALPLVMRRESQSLIMNMTVCALVLGAFFVFGQVSLVLGGSIIGGTLIPLDLAAWCPVIVTGGATVWTAGYVQT